MNHFQVLLLTTSLFSSLSCKTRRDSTLAAPVPKRAALKLLNAEEVAKFLAKLKGRYVYKSESSDIGTPQTKYFTCFNENEIFSEIDAEKYCKDNSKNNETRDACVTRLMLTLFFRLSPDGEDMNTTMTYKDNSEKMVLNRPVFYEAINRNGGAVAQTRFARLKNDGRVLYFDFYYSLPPTDDMKVYLKGDFKIYSFAEEGKLRITNRKFETDTLFPFDLISKISANDESAVDALEKTVSELAKIVVDKGFERDAAVRF